MLKKLQAKLITNKGSVAYLSNFTGSSGFMLLTKKVNYLFTDFRYIQRAKDNLKKGIELVDITRMWRNPKSMQEHWQKILKKHNVKILGIEEQDLTIARFKKFKKISGRKLKFIDISGKLEAVREIKTKKEIALITKSQRINEKVFLEIKKIVQQYRRSKSQKPIYECDLAWKIKELGHKYGAEDVSFDPIVAFGPHTAIPHHESDKTKFKKDDFVLVDMGMKYKGYCSDMTRMILPPNPTEKQKKIYNLVLEAQMHAIKNIKTGVSGKNADKLSRDIIKKAGYGEKYGHAGGHGIGLDIHEIPSLAENYKKPLRANSIITVEPGIYLEGEFGVRIEDMVLVTKTGCKNLTKISKTI